MAWSLTDLGGVADNTNLTVTFSSLSIPSGALMVVGIYEQFVTATSNTVTDSNSDSFGTIGTANPNNTNANGVASLQFFAATTSITSLSYTKKSGLAATVVAMAALYATGQRATSPLDAAVTATAAGQGTTASVTSGTPTVSNELFIAWNPYLGATSWGQDTGHGWSGTGGLAQCILAGPTFEAAGANQVNAGTGTIIYATTSGSVHNWASFVAGFIPAPPVGVLSGPIGWAENDL